MRQCLITSIGLRFIWGAFNDGIALTRSPHVVMVLPVIQSQAVAVLPPALLPLRLYFN